MSMLYWLPLLSCNERAEANKAEPRGEVAWISDDVSIILSSSLTRDASELGFPKKGRSSVVEADVMETRARRTNCLNVVIVDKVSQFRDR